MTRQEHLLIILSEECAEVIKEVSKALRFGLDDKEPGQDHTNAKKITDEYYDIVAIIIMLRKEGCLKRLRHDVIIKKIEDKKIKVEKYFEYSRKQETLNN